MDERAILLRRVYGAYQYLAAHDLTDVSATSRLLHAPQPDLFAARALEELDELAGTVAGTHTHTGGTEDITLEASQVLYWSFLLAVTSGDGYDALAPHSALLSGASTPPPTGTVTQQPDDLANRSMRRAFLQNVLQRTGALMHQAGVPAVEAVRRDMRDLQSKPYLSAYWAEDHVDEPRGKQKR